MKKIIIVDDEITMCDGLSALISSTSEYNVVAKCKNGKEALKAIEKYVPDIVITDIKMPVMDGLTLINKCLLKENIKFIILSGYEEFEYARKAHKLNVYDYILKPIDYSKFLDLLKKVSKEIDEQKKDNQLVYTQIGMLVIQKSVSSIEIAKKMSEKKRIDLNTSQVMVINVSESNRTDKKLLEDITAYLKYYFNKFDIKHIVFLYKKQHVVIFPEYIITRYNIPYLITELPGSILSEFKQHVTIGIGKKAHSLYEVNKSYMYAVSALYERIYEQNKRVFYYKPEWQNLKNVELFYFEEKKQIIDSINELDLEKSIKCIDDFLNTAKHNMYPPQALFSFLKEAYLIYYKIDSDNNYRKETENHLDFYEDLIHDEFNIKQVREKLINIVNKSIKMINIENKNYFNNIVDNVIKYVNLHYNDEINLDVISNKFHINICYFCRIFKQKTGITFNNYLNKIRIEKSKELLRDSDYKVYEVSEHVGFKDPKYFSKIFKISTGKTPSEFKNTKYCSL